MIKDANRSFSKTNCQRQNPLDRFSNKLKKCNSHAAWLTTISEDDDETESTFASEEVLSILHNLPFMFHDNKDLNKESSRSFFQDQFKTLSCSEEKCSEIEKND